MSGEASTSILVYTDLRRNSGAEKCGERMYVGRNAQKVSLRSGEEEDWNFGWQWKHQIVSWLFQTFVLLILRTRKNFEPQSWIPTLMNKVSCWHLRLALIRGQKSFFFLPYVWLFEHQMQIQCSGEDGGITILHQHSQYLWHWPENPPAPILWGLCLHRKRYSWPTSPQTFTLAISWSH